ncbi:hypothetical protein IFM89_017943 [Coptis chinensis]|uniref:Uncharacterized protein n=1 Tax=Coptis chinensis TaxID=261450 RepID=A0A835HRE2_9MAGN|nr:hypothetical protein IFM89_017943 [Coptis chinensis]
MAAQISEPESQPPISSCRKKKSKEASFVEDESSHIDGSLMLQWMNTKTALRTLSRRCFECQRLSQRRMKVLKKLKVLFPFRHIWPTRI